MAEPNSTQQFTAPEQAAPTSVGQNLMPSHKRRNTIIAAIAAVVIVAGIAGAWALGGKKAPVVSVGPKTSPTTAPSPTPATKLSPLTGVAVTPAEADRPIVGVVIENHPDARPQSGLSDAGVVYEANAEGGITRFLAFFLEKRPAQIGPVRSLRTYFQDWGLEFNAPVAHAGGNADALDRINPLRMKDINALSFAADGFFRITSRAAPHNLYSTSDKMDALLSRLKFSQPSEFTPSPRKTDAPNANAPHPNIHIEYSYNGFQVDYKYDPTTNDYARSLAGKPHIDQNTGKQIRVKNIVVEMMPTSYGTTRVGEQTVIMQTVGKGQGWVIRDGDVIPCTWEKTAQSLRTKLLDASGQDIPLNPGNTWYSIVPVGKSVSF